MQPIPIDEHLVWDGAARCVVGPPTGFDTTGAIRPVEAVIDRIDPGDGSDVARFNMRIALDRGDIERLTEDPHFWVSIIGESLAPFDVALVPSGVHFETS